MPLTEDQIRQNEETNKTIQSAIRISRLQDSEDFNEFWEWLDEQEKIYKFQDIRGIADLQTLHNQQGLVQMIFIIKNFFERAKDVALQPMIDPETGEREVLNNKK